MGRGYAIGFENPPVSFFDDRYVTIVEGLHSGDLPVGYTGYMGKQEVQDDINTLYIAQQAELVTRLEVYCQTASPPTEVDTYTVYLNGVAQLMTVSVTGPANTNFTTSNQIALVAGDRLAIQVVTDPSTTSADVIAQITIEKA